MVPCSNLGPNTGHPELYFGDIPQSVQTYPSKDTTDSFQILSSSSVILPFDAYGLMYITDNLVHEYTTVTTSKDPDARGHTPSTTWTKWQQVATAGDTPDDWLIEARNM